MATGLISDIERQLSKKEHVWNTEICAIGFLKSNVVRSSGNVMLAQVVSSGG